MEKRKKISAWLPVVREFLRYLVVGGSAFVVDIGALYLTRTFVFQNLGTAGILLATACGFTAGLAYNYVLSTRFVFKIIDPGAARHKIRSFVLFAIIGVAGLALTELCMYAGTRLLGQRFYLAVKVVTAGLVLLWNYGARKLIIFKGAKIGG